MGPPKSTYFYARMFVERLVEDIVAGVSFKANVKV